MSTVTRLDRARGLLLGLALGDALGAPFEGHPDVTEADILAVERGDRPLTYTDDTALALVLAGHLARRLGTDPALDSDTLASEFAEAWRREPDRGYGGTVREVFRLIDTGVPWREAGATFGGEGSL
ncbi:ADP-ribosylglycohydrolase family protein, partial [Saccharomonospora halophila]|uniref:ADP-ribosylglycohydrolase family protein n=1 Tax=Saccharomonospora halophila TaxID=129922 RepID=UPI0003650DC0